MPFALPAAATAMAAAAPAAAAAASSAALTSTLVSVASQVALNMAVSAVMSALSPQVGAAGRPVDWTLNPDGPIPFAFGRVGVAGSVVHKRTFGPDKMYYGFVSVLSGAGPIAGYNHFFGDDQIVTFDGNGKAVTSQWEGEMWRVSRLGLQPDTYLPTPVGLKNSAQMPDWESDHVLSGKACTMLVMGENSKRTAYPNGEVKPLEDILGLYAWDPRLDSTWPGGSGSCRLNNPATWVWSQNPMICALKWALGLWEGPVGKGAPQVDQQVGGIGAKLSGIDVPALLAAANVADANGWYCAAYPSTDDDKHQVLASFMQAAGAIYTQRAGKISCIQRAAPRASVVTITANDVVGALEIDTAASRIDRINTIRPRFWSPDHRWQLTAIDEVTADAYRTEDGGKRTRGIDYPYVTNATQAAQLAALDIANTREGIAGIVPLKPHLQRIRPGDAFTISEPGFVLDGVKCLCLNTDYDPATGIVSVTFVSETDAKYPFALGLSPDAPVPPVLTPVDPRQVNPPEPGDWTVVPRPPSSGGGQTPGFDLTGTVNNATAHRILVEFGPDDDGPWTQAYLGPPTVERIPLDGVQPGQTYYVAVSYFNRAGNQSDRQVYGPYVAPDLIADDLSPTSPIRDDLLSLETGLAILENRRLGVRNLNQRGLWAVGEAFDDIIWGASRWGLRLTNAVPLVDALPLALKPSTAYSLRFRAKVASGAGPVTLSVDLYPDTLPETSRVVTTTDTSFVWEGIVSASSDMGAASLRFFGTIPSGVVVEVTDILLVEGDTAPLGWIAAPEEMAVIEGRTSTLETWRGAATTQITELDLAIATEEATRALQIAQVKAVWRGRALNLNPAFAVWPDGGVVAEWSTSGVVDRVSGLVSEYAARLTGPASIAQQNLTALRAVAGGWFVLEADIRLLAGTLASGTLGLQVYDDAYATPLGGVAYTLSTQTTATGVAPGTGSASESYRWRILIDGRSSATRLLRPYVEAASGTSLAVDFLAVRFATDSEIETAVTLGPLEATVDTHSEVLIDHAEWLATARWRVRTAASGGNPAVLELISSTGDPSVISMAADQINFGGNTVFVDASDTLQTLIGGGSTRRVIALGAAFGAASELIQWRGPSGIALGSMTRANAAYWETETESGGNGLGGGGGAISKLEVISGTAGTYGTYAEFGRVDFTGVPSGGVVVEAIWDASGFTYSSWTGIIALVESNGVTTTTIFGSVFEVIGGVPYINGVPGPIRMYGEGNLSGAVTYLIMGTTASGLPQSAAAYLATTVTARSA